MSEERALIDRAVRGEPEAFRELVDAHRPTVVRTARHVLADPVAAEDVAQDAFVRLQASLDSFRGEASIATWLHRVAVNLCRDRLRRARLERGRVEHAAPVDETGTEPDAGRSVDLERARRAVRAAVERLPREQREAVVLRYFEDRPYEEIARMTGTPQGTVASRVFRALERLGRDLDARYLEVLQ